MIGAWITRALLPATFLSVVAVAAAHSQETPGVAPGGAVAPAPPAAPAPILREAVFRYEGQLTWGGAAFTGVVDLEFRLFDALIEGAIVGEPLFADAYSMQDGIVQVDLDFNAMLVAGQPYFLQITIDGTSLLPRQKIVLPAGMAGPGTTSGPGIAEASAAESESSGERPDRGAGAGPGSAGASSDRGSAGRPDQSAPPGIGVPPLPPDDGGNPPGGGGVAGGGGGTGGTDWQVSGANIFFMGGNVGIGTASPVNRLDVLAPSPANQTRAILGRASAGTGITIGMSGQSDSVNGRGIFGVATAPVGPTIGLFGLANSKDGTGLFGLANSATGVTTGLTGQAVSPDGFAVRALGAKSYFEGRIGIGTTNPQAKLDIAGTVGLDGIRFPDGSFQFRGMSVAGGDLTGTYPNPTIKNDAITSAKIAAGAVQNADLGNSSVTDPKVFSVGWDKLISVPPGFADGIDNVGPTSPWGQSGGNVFYTTGDVGLGTNSPTQQLEVVGQVLIQGPSNDAAIFIDTQSGGPNDQAAIRARGNGLELIGEQFVYLDCVNAIGKIQAHGAADLVWHAIEAASFDVMSSRDLKKEIRKLDETELARALDEVLAMEPAEYLFKWEESGNAARPHLGLIAQELPETIAEITEDGASVDLYALVTTLVAATKQLKAQQDEELEALRQQKDAEIAELTRRLDALENFVRSQLGGAP